MGDSAKTRDQLMDDLKILRKRIRILEKAHRNQEQDKTDVIVPKDLLQTIPDIVYKVDTKGRFTYVNEAVSILGYKPEDLMGRTFDRIVHPDDMKGVSRKHVLPGYKGKTTGPEKAPKLFDERRTGERRTQKLEIRLIHKTTHRSLREEDILTGLLFSYGELTSAGHYRVSSDGTRREHVGSIGVIHDITPWKHAEIELRESEQRYRSLVEDMPALVCRFLKDGTLTFVNNEYCEYFGKKAEDLVGSSWISLLPKKERQKVKKHFMSLGRKNPAVTYEHEVLGPDGSKRWQRWTDRALFDLKGAIREYQSVGFDITERKLSELALEESEARLAHQNMQLQEKNMAIREMMEQVKIEKERVEQRIAANAEKLIQPFLSRLMTSRQPIEKKHIEIVQKNIRQLTSDFGTRLASRAFRLTQREIEVCNLIKEGMTSKEISRLLHVSTKTVENHRNNIRTKLGITNKDANLHTYLLKLP